MMGYKKKVRDGKVAVLISTGYGAGWSSWNIDFEKEAMFDAELVQAVLDGNLKEAGELASLKYDSEDNYFCSLGWDGLKVVWVEQGLKFRINEYDGHESLEIIGEGSWEVA